MARIMPYVLPVSAPPGERAVFRALAEGPGTDNWSVLHSLFLARHVRQVEGEADFVVIVPHQGILVIEVKSHKTIDCRPDGTWKLGNDLPTERGPFRQANEAMHSIRGWLGQSVELRSVPILCAVWFTGVRARTMLPPSPEWHDWQVLDSEDLKDVPAAIMRVLDAGAKHLKDKIRLFGYGGLGPDLDTSERIVGRLRPRFELATVAADCRRARRTQLAEFVDEQYLALDSACDNRAVLFSGPAGSGKTFLAMESTRRELALGGNGSLLCFNRLLGKSLIGELGGEKGLKVGTFHQELLRISGLDSVPDCPTEKFWLEELPDRAVERLIDGGDDLQSDFLVIDEIQDLAIEPYIDLFDLMVRGGLAGGRLLLFGDFERQAIFDNQEGRALLAARIPHLTFHKLVQNCRNMPRIGYQVNILSQLQPGYTQFRRVDDGVDPTLNQYLSGEDQSILLAKAIRDLKDDGFELSEIVVLSPLQSGSTASTTRDPWLRQVLRPVDGSEARPGQVRYSTIQAFKGLEAPAVVVTDLDESAVAGPFDAVVYVGLTRATDRLVAFFERATLRKLFEGMK